MQQDSQALPSLLLEQAQAIAQLVGLSEPLCVTEITQNNHVWQLESGKETFFLKVYTKDWYGDDVPRTEYCVRHERDAYALLARHGLPTVEVILARPDCDNPLARPFLVTRKLKGTSLNALLAQAEPKHFYALLEAAGSYMNRMHALTFAYAGYIIEGGPLAAPAANEWQHPAWSIEACQRNALMMLERDRPMLSRRLAEALQAIYNSLDERLATAYQPLRFVQVNTHSHQFFMHQQPTNWQVSGVLDMEVASAGDPFFDLVAFGLEMATLHPASTRWWEPFFHGYHGEPDFELFRLHMLTFGEESFKCFGPEYWPGTRDEILSRLLTAKKWAELFAT